MSSLGTPATAPRSFRCPVSRNVWPLNTVQFSIDTQYGHWTGSAIDASQMQDLVEGIGAIGVLPRCDAVLSGYLGTPDQAQAVIEIVKAVKAANPRACISAIG